MCMEETSKLRAEIDALRNEFRIFRDNHFYHMVRDNDQAHDDIMDQLKDKKLWLATGATLILVIINLVK